jgi:TonB family protein
MKNLLILLLICTSTLSYGQEPGETILDFSEVNPEFPGGSAKMDNYINQNMVYPKLAIENKEYGKVYISFVVEQDGTLSNLDVVRGISTSLDEEAIRIVHSMPNWIPGRNNGELARVRYRLPISFRLVIDGKVSEQKKGGLRSPFSEKY